MKVIGVGFARTGTLSTHAALQRLGYGCYHMAEVILRPDHLRTWHNFVVGGAAMDWKALFKDYEATMDFPAALFYRELLEVFPRAKVLLNVRDPERWYASYMTHVEIHAQLAPHRSTVPELDLFLSLIETLDKRVLGGSMEKDKRDCLRVFEQHIERVKAAVPEDRLLVFNVRDGWEPLCAFLDCEVPTGEPFPHLNEGTDMVRAFLHHAFLGSEIT